MARLRPKRSVRANFRRVLPRLLRRYFRRGRRLVESRASFPELHQFRIRTKRVRYTTELYQKPFPKLISRAAHELQVIQGILGALQDQCMVVAYFERRLANVRRPKLQAEYLRLLHRARARRDAHREAFERRWAYLEKARFAKQLLAALPAS